MMSVGLWLKMVSLIRRLQRSPIWRTRHLTMTVRLNPSSLWTWRSRTAWLRGKNQPQWRLLMRRPPARPWRLTLMSLTDDATKRLTAATCTGLCGQRLVLAPVNGPPPA